MRDKIIDFNSNDVQIELNENQQQFSPMTIWTPEHRKLICYYFSEYGDLILNGKNGDLRFICFLCQIFGNVRECPIKK